MNIKNIIWIFAIIFLLVSVNVKAENSYQEDFETVNSFKIVEIDKEKIKDIKNIKIDNKGKIDILLEVNSSYCGKEMQKTKYYMLQNANGEKVKFQNKIMVDNSCKNHMYYELIIFNLLEKNFTAGNYALFRWTNNMYLFVQNINITGEIPSVIDNQKKEKDIFDKIYDLIKAFFEEISRILNKEEKEDFTLDVKTVDWVKVGQNWNVNAIFKKNGVNVNNGECMLNTNFWGTRLMNYDPVLKTYNVELSANKEGVIKWTVECGY